MKSPITRFTLLLAFIFPFVASAQMDNLANMSAKWIRLNARNAALEGADIVNYNPAGLVKLNDGLHFSLNNQTLFRSPKHSFNLGYGKQDFKQDGTDPFLPSFYAAYKKSKLAISSGVYVTSGGASANYPDGSINIYLKGFQSLTAVNNAYGTHYSKIESSLKASSYYIAIPLNFSYAINENLSVSLGGRYLIAKNSVEADLNLPEISTSASVDYKKNATGFGGVIGLNYSLNEKLNFAIHYESKVKLEFEAKDNKGNTILEANGSKSNRDLPAVLYTGISYKFSDKFTTLLDFNYYFQNGANWEKATDPSTGKTVEVSDAAGNCYHVALGLQYQILPKLQVSAGCKYIHFDYDNQELYYTQMGVYESVKYDNFNLGVGAGYSVNDKVKIDLGIGRTFWKDKTISRPLSPTLKSPVDISNKAYVVALGVDVSF